MSPSPDGPSPGRRVASMAALGAIGLFVGFSVGIVLFGLVGTPLSISAETATGQILFAFGTYLGVAGAGMIYLLRYELPLSYVRIERPTIGDLGAVVATTVILVVLAAALSMFLTRVGVPITDHGITETIEANPTVALAFLPLSILLVGPAEEFLYRGIIQTRLGEVFDTGSAIALAALIFAVVHVFAYLDPANVPGTIATIVFLLLPLGAILGVVYEYTGNLVVPALAHGIYNAITFGMVYGDVVGLW